MTAHEQGNNAEAFISHVLSGTVTRVDLTLKHGQVSVQRVVQIASGYTATTDPAALVIGPNGLAFDARTNTLYVASTGDNAIYAIPHAGTRRSDAGTGAIIYQDDVHLHGPL